MGAPLNMSEFDKLYHLTKMAVDAPDDTSIKERMITIAEDEVIDLLHDGDELFVQLFGETWRDKVGVIASSISGVAMENTSKRMDLTVLDGMSEEQSKILYDTIRVAGQIGLVAGFVLALKASGSWDRLNRKPGGGKNGKD